MLHLNSACWYSNHFTYGRGDLLSHHQCAASTWMMRQQPYNTTHQLIGGED